MHLDTDDFFWLPTDPPFTTVRERGERLSLLTAATERNAKCVVSGSLSGWGDALIPRFDLVIYVDTTTKVRLERLEKREFERFGERIMPGGDMYDEHIAFMKWAGEYDGGGLEMRSRAMHTEWLAKLACRRVTVDGRIPAAQTAERIEEIFNG